MLPAAVSRRPQGSCDLGLGSRKEETVRGEWRTQVISGWKGIANRSKTREKTLTEDTAEKVPASPKFEGGGSNSSVTKQVRTQCLKDPGQAPRPHNDDAAMKMYLWAAETAPARCHVPTSRT